MTRVYIVTKADTNAVLHTFDSQVIPEIGEVIRVGSQYMNDEYIVHSRRHELTRDTRVDTNGKMVSADYHDIYLICDKN